MLSAIQHLPPCVPETIVYAAMKQCVMYPCEEVTGSRFEGDSRKQLSEIAPVGTH